MDDNDADLGEFNRKTEEKSPEESTEMEINQPESPEKSKNVGDATDNLNRDPYLSTSLNFDKVPVVILTDFLGNDNTKLNRYPLFKRSENSETRVSSEPCFVYIDKKETNSSESNVSFRRDSDPSLPARASISAVSDIQENNSKPSTADKNDKDVESKNLGLSSDGN